MRQPIARNGKQISGFSAEVAAKLLAYSWPGNVRELQNSVERAVAMARFTRCFSKSA
jgi:two-component system, NtrC family, response regulator HydG